MPPLWDCDVCISVSGPSSPSSGPALLRPGAHTPLSPCAPRLCHTSLCNTSQHHTTLSKAGALGPRRGLPSPPWGPSATARRPGRACLHAPPLRGSRGPGPFPAGLLACSHHDGSLPTFLGTEHISTPSFRLRYWLEVIV